MTQLTINTIETRRPGFWIVAAGARLFTVEIGLDRTTFEHFYRVTRGSCFEQFPRLEAAFDFCSYCTA